MTFDYFKEACVMCLFCDIAAHRKAAYVVDETERTITILDIDPAHEGHVLILPKLHVDSIVDLPDDYVMEIVGLTRKLVKTYQALYNAPGYGVMQNGGANSDFGHFHFHVFPRWPDDGYDWIYPEGKKTVDKTVAEKIAEVIRKINNNCK